MAAFRNVSSFSTLYVGKRSFDLLKMKEFDDAEFRIVGIEEGRGKLTGHISGFVCVTNDGKTFTATLNGELSFLKQCFDDPTIWTGKSLVVQYQGLTKYGIPRFPRAVRFRDSEDF